MELEFRVWDKIEEKYLESVDDIQLRNFTNKSSLVACGNGVFREARHFVFEQSTGQKDQDGITMFEGDIVERFFMDGSITCVIKRSEFYPRLNLMPIDTCKYGHQCMFRWWKKYSVIGNIHQNKDLLGENNE